VSRTRLSALGSLARAVGVTALAVAVALAGILAVGPSSAASAADETSTSDGPQQGIQVHGHWTIEVRDPDGTLVSHTEFENSLQSTGQSFLTWILSRQYSLGLWRLFVGPEPCAGPTFCIIGEAGDNETGSNVFKTLTVSTADGGTKVVLQGTATAANDSSISSVNTAPWLCNPTVAPSPSPCNGSPASGTFQGVVVTSATVSPAVSVAAGQQIGVKVTLSFS
jgi:hypothetical protein